MTDQSSRHTPCAVTGDGTRSVPATLAGPRVVLVSRRYWPQVGAAETLVANLAGELRRLGARPLVVTAQVERTWPAEVVHRETPVLRLPHSVSRFWGSFRYLGALSRWLQAKRDEYDVVCVSSLQYDAYSVLGALAGSGVPVVLRAERGGPEGDCQWQRKASFGTRVRRRCVTAQAIIAPTEAIAGELRMAGYPLNRIHTIPSGVPLPPLPEASRREAARASLAAAHPILGRAENGPLVVYVGRLVEGRGLLDLVDAWPAVQKRWPLAKLWLVGQGPYAESVWRRIERRELKSDVILTGLFDDLEDVLLSADLFVYPAVSEGSCLALREAMAAGLPIVATNLPTPCELLSTDSALLIPPHNPAALSGAIIQLLADRPLAERLASSARRVAEEKCSLTGMAQRHLELFESLLAQK